MASEYVVCPSCGASFEEVVSAQPIPYVLAVIGDSLEQALHPVPRVPGSGPVVLDYETAVEWLRLIRAARYRPS